MEPLHGVLDADAHLAALERPEHLPLERVELAVPHQAGAKADIQQPRRVASPRLAIVGEAHAPRLGEAVARIGQLAQAVRPVADSRVSKNSFSPSEASCSSGRQPISKLRAPGANCGTAPTGVRP